MELVYGEILVVTCSNKVLFFKQIWDKMEEITKWIEYDEIKVRGFVNYIKSIDPNDHARIQITSDKFIYFYTIDKETFVPALENVMNNFYRCTQMVIGGLNKYSINFKQNQTCFDVYSRKYMHNLRITCNSANYENCKPLEIISSRLLMVTKLNRVVVYDSSTLKECGEIPIELLAGNSREPNQVIGIQKSSDENWLGIISGKNLVMNEQMQNQLFIMKRVRSDDPDKVDQYV